MAPPIAGADAGRPRKQGNTRKDQYHGKSDIVHPIHLRKEIPFQEYTFRVSKKGTADERKIGIPGNRPSPGERTVKNLRCIATFEVTSMALLFERTCRKKDIPAKVVPVPRRLSSSCGLACEFPCESGDDVRALCEERKIDVESYHEMEDDWT